MAEFRPGLPRFEDRLQSMIRNVDDRLGDVAIIDGVRVKGSFKVSYSAGVSLGGARMSKQTKVTSFKFQKCCKPVVKPGDHVFINNTHYTVGDGGIKYKSCGYCVIYLRNCGSCEK